jgi:hypothetical protein
MNQNNQHIDFTDLKATHQETADSNEQKKSVFPDPENQKKKVRVKEIIDGTFLVRENMIRQLPYLLFLTFLGVIYIGNRFHAEHMVRQINELKIEVSNLRAEQITTTSELMNISRPSEVAALVESKGLGLKESMEPPKKLRR